MIDPTPKVSVLLITYQHAAFIEQCLQSILSQKTDFQYEVVIGEDGSTDGTQEICKRYAKKYPDIIRLFIRDQSKKVYLYGKATGKYNLIKTLQDGRGEYFAFCDGDDYWTDPLKLQKQVDTLDANPEYSFCTTDIMILKDGEFSGDTNLDRVLKENGNTPVVVTLDNFANPYIVQTNVMMIRKSFLDLNLLAERYTQVRDTFIWFQLLSRGNGIVLPLKTGVYRHHPGGRWTSLKTFELTRMNYHTIKGMFESYLGKEPAMLEYYGRVQFAYVWQAMKTLRLKTAMTILSDNPTVFAKNLVAKASKKISGKRQRIR